MNALAQSNEYQVPSYGTDHWSHEVSQIFKKEFGNQTESYLVFNGTAANVLSLRALVRNYQSVFCSDVSHLLLDECGAPEAIAGVKLFPVPSHNGKMTVEQLDKLWIRRGDQHYAQTEGISITQPTELGTVYTIEELRELIQWSKSKNLKIHIDGARLANAALFLQKSFRDFTSNLGVDIISFGGTKNGLMMGEAVILCNPELSKDFRYIRKQSLQLPSKSRFIATQFLAYFHNELWKDIAETSLLRAQQLFSQTQNLPGVKVHFPVESNAVFAQIPRPWLKPLRDKFFFYVWDENSTVCRWMTSWDTTADDVTQFASEIKNCSAL